MIESETLKHVSVGSPLGSKAKQIYCQIHKKFFKVNDQLTMCRPTPVTKSIEHPKHESFSQFYGIMDDVTLAPTKEETENVVEEPSYSWCHSGLSRIEAQEKLSSLKEDGMYLMRKSSQPDIPHVLCLYHQDKVYHIKIRQIEGKFMIGDKRTAEPVFSSLQALVTHFHRFPVILKEDKSTKALLRTPLPQ